jgi:hypothetical protein
VESVRLYRQALPVLAETLGPQDARVKESASNYKRLVKEAERYVLMLR